MSLQSSIKTAWVQIRTLPLTCHVTLGSSLDLSVTQFPHLLRVLMLVPEYPKTVASTTFSSQD